MPHLDERNWKSPNSDHHPDVTRGGRRNVRNNPQLGHGPAKFEPSEILSPLAVWVGLQAIRCESESDRILVTSLRVGESATPTCHAASRGWEFARYAED